jgi:peptide/nickel transport system substrate-binding protein
VKYSYDIQKTEGSSIYKPFLENIKSIDLVDDYNLTMHLIEPDAAIYMATFAQIYIIPEHIWSQVPDPKADYVNDMPVGSGPFNLVYWRPDEELFAEANKDYQFPPKPDGYAVVAYANPDAVFQGLLNQEVDTNYDPLNAVQAQLAEETPHLTVTIKPSHQVRLVGYNVRFPPFDDPNFRDAIGYTIDFDTIIEVMLNGYGIPGSGVISPVNEFWHNPNVTYRRYDPEKARELLAAAGYEWDEEGLMYMPASE